MSLVIPDVVLANTVNRVLVVLRDDYNNHELAGTPTKSMLWLLFGGVTLGTYDFYQNAVALIVTTPEEPKNIECRLSYDHTSNSVAPFIWITLPSESPKNNTLGIGAGNQDPLLISSDPQDEYRNQFNYRWSTTYQIVVGAQNKNEVAVLYHLIKAMLVACIEHMEGYGLSNIKISGQDIRFAQIPDRFFTKAISVNFEYEQVIPEIEVKNVYRKLRLFWREEQAVVAKGPILISVEDDISSSSS